MGDLTIRRFAHFDGPFDDYIEIARRVESYTPDMATLDEIYTKALLNPDNSFHRTSTSMNFIAYRGSNPVGRLTAFNNRLLKDLRGRFGFIGLFACEDDKEVANSLVTMAAGWLAQQGIQMMRGPMDGDIWHRWRFMVRGFETDPFPGEPRHPEYYPRLFRETGFAPVRSYSTKLIKDAWQQLEFYKPAMDTNRERGITFRDVFREELETELPTLHSVYVNSMAVNWTVTSAPIEEFSAVFRRKLHQTNPEFVILAEDPQGSAVGLGIGIIAPEDTVNLLTVVALPSQVGYSLGQAIAGEITRRSIETGRKQLHHCLLDPYTPAQRWDHGLGEVTREYALYERSV